MPKRRVVHIVPGMNPGGGPGGYAFQLSNAFRRFPSDRYEISFYEVQFQPAHYDSGIRQSIGWRLASSIARHPYWQKPGLKTLKSISSELVSKIIEHPDKQKSGLEKLAMEAEQWSRLAREPDASLWENDLIVVHFTLVAGQFLKRRTSNSALAVMSHSPTPVYLEMAAAYEPKMSSEELVRDETVARLLQRELSIYEQADFIIAPSLSSVDGYRSTGPEWGKVFSSSKVVTCLSGTSAPVVSREAKDWRRQLGVANGQLLAVFVGRDHPHKGIDMLMSAVSKLRQQGDHSFVLACAGLQTRGRAIDAVVELGYIKDIGGLLGAADFVISVDRCTYFNLSCLEALSMGKPLLLTNVGGNKEIKKYVPSTEITECTSEGIAAGIQRLASAGDLTERGILAKEAWATIFSPEAFCKHHEQAYDAILSNNATKQD